MNALIRRGPRYLAVSLFCVVLSNAILIGTSRLGYSSAAAILLATIILVLVGYGLQAYVTFAVRPSLDGLARYASALALNMPLSWLILFVLHDTMGIDMKWAAPCTTALLFPWNYLISTWALKRRPVRLVDRAAL